MSRLLIEKLRRAREVKVTVDGHTYTVRRPTDVEAVEMHKSDGEFSTWARRFVIGWDLCELDVVPGGGPDPVPFDPDLWAEWVADRPDLWVPLADAIFSAYQAHADARKGHEKNS